MQRLTSTALLSVAKWMRWCAGDAGGGFLQALLACRKAAVRCFLQDSKQLAG
jgi:hypothetical protein